MFNFGDLFGGMSVQGGGADGQPATLSLGGVPVGMGVRAPNWGKGPVNQTDLDDYRRYLGEMCASPMDAFRYSDLCGRVSALLNHKDKLAYDTAIRLLKSRPAPTGGARDAALATISEMEAKAQGANPSRVGKQRARMDNIAGLRVRLASDKTKRGVVVPDGLGLTIADEVGRRFQVKLDGETTTCSFSRTELNVLCSVCGEDAPNRCSRCTSQPYCSPACQRGDWAQHKPNCKKLAGAE